MVACPYKIVLCTEYTATADNRHLVSTLLWRRPTAIAQMLFGDISPSGKLPYTVYPEVWANNTEMTDMSLTAGDGQPNSFPLVQETG